jgi:hypothetical protein
MSALQNNIDQAFCQTIENLNSQFGKKDTTSSLHLKFMEHESRLFYYAKGCTPKPIEFGRMISQKMIGLGITVEKIYMALHWLKKESQRTFKIHTNDEISLLLFTTEKMKLALVGVCIGGQLRISYPLSDLLNQFESKQEQLN